ncbi:carbohydrate ABC transporter permease [Desulfomonile tiedjei]|nr:sugar ABC transporter permease [Desulfomonile tiedjei]
MDTNRENLWSVRERILGYLFLMPLLTVLLIFCFCPILYSFVLSFYRIVLSLPGLGETFVGLDNYRELLRDPVAVKSLKVTLLFVAVSTILEISLGLFIAIVIHENFRGRGLVRAAILVPWAIPTVVASQLWRFAFNDQYGMVNYILFGPDVIHYQAWLASPFWASTAIIIADVWKTSSFAALVILAGLQTIPDELYEAASIDGANRFQRFVSITLPLLKSSILLAFVFRTMDAFRVFDLVYVMTQGGPANSTNVLQFYGYRVLFDQGMIGLGSAVSFIVFLLVFIVSVTYLKLVGTALLQKKEAIR